MCDATFCRSTNFSAMDDRLLWLCSSLTDIFFSYMSGFAEEQTSWNSYVRNQLFGWQIMYLDPTPSNIILNLQINLKKILNYIVNLKNRFEILSSWIPVKNSFTRAKAFKLSFRCLSDLISKETWRILHFKKKTWRKFLGKNTTSFISLYPCKLCFDLQTVRSNYEVHPKSNWKK